ncbi:GDSL-type esterase/lipase family protein [Lentzea sp. NEAU-D7]|uniref:GDSL-type esterase/lipase family protein n=1 Tax=Lentzea sp. NEAU-D7 TaxID=2994667 RepID=UPI00224A8D2E|nr:GDSL-type esterase/lipase family protein [Lentzea sp. NEAU-D7]MCX2948714.1 GDSL-type esterase/lipase family protein [Lentzea sp. NEAU-D7]MCX2951272.1 GDSL-type esterase/lipase family protein [Lentzea sp. NEAU-D7]
MRTRNLAIASTVLAVAALLTPAALADRPVWFTSWAQSQQNLAPVTLHDQSMRMITRLSQGGSAVRIRVQNTFGRQPLTIDRTTVALSAGGAAVEGTRDVTFGGRRAVTIPAGGEMWSDRTSLNTVPDTDLAVSMHVAGEVVPGRHDAAFRDNYLTPPGSGDHTTGQGAAYTQTVQSTYLVSAVDVFNPRLKGTVVPFGSSVVDGVGSTDCGPGCTELGTNKRWTDVLARRIAASPGPQLAVANAGVSGTTSAVCPRTPAPFVGLDALSRLERDVLALHGVSDVIYYYGTNDLANGCTAADIVTSYRAVFQRLREAGIAVHVTPITPRPGYSDQNNVDRHAVNDFVKRGGDCSDTCAAVQDFDQVLEDPIKPNSINAQYDVGDGVHVNIRGQRAIADYIALETIA